MPRLDKREQIMQVAEKLFSSKRLHEITLDHIARAAQVGKGTIYTHFKDKDDLFFQVATAGFDELCDLLTRRVAEDASFTQQLLQACEATTAFFSRRRQLFRMIQTEDARMSLCRGQLHERWFQKRQHLVRSLSKILHKGQRDGLVREDLSDQTLADFLLGLLRARAKHLQDENVHVSNEALVNLFLDGAGRSNADSPVPTVVGSAANEAQT
jgi:AcrR family transcriptional regulator